MKLVVEGRQEVSKRYVRIVIPCYESIYPCASDLSSITVYLKKEEEIEVYDNKQKVQNVDVLKLSRHEENNYYHICMWDTTMGGYLDVTMDFYLEGIRITVFADDYDESKIVQTNYGQ